MLFVRCTKIRKLERGLHFRDREFVGMLGPGDHWILDLFNENRIDVTSIRKVWFQHGELDVIVKSGALKDQAEVLDLKDSERALVWVDGRFEAVLDKGLYALWTAFHEVYTEIVDAGQVKFEHKDLTAIRLSDCGQAMLNQFTVEPGHVGLYFLDGEYMDTLDPGVHAFWKDAGKVTLHKVDMRDCVVDVNGQEIMSTDKVTLRLNAAVTYRVTDPLKTLMVADNAMQALYREAQLALRAVIGTRKLDDLLSDKDAVAEELEELIRNRAARFGLEVTAFGIRDVILPGDMKELMNRVTEAQKEAEANLIARREETAAMRSQANTARILEANPTLMRLRELEVLEKISGNSKLSVVLGEKGLADRVVNLI